MSGHPSWWDPGSDACAVRRVHPKEAKNPELGTGKARPALQTELVSGFVECTAVGAWHRPRDGCHRRRGRRVVQGGAARPRPPSPPGVAEGRPTTSSLPTPEAAGSRRMGQEAAEDSSRRSQRAGQEGPMRNGAPHNGGRRNPRGPMGSGTEGKRPAVPPRPLHSSDQGWELPGQAALRACWVRQREWKGPEGYPVRGEGTVRAAPTRAIAGGACSGADRRSRTPRRGLPRKPSPVRR